MDRRIKEIIDSLGVALEYREGLDSDGYFISAINTIVIKADLSEWKMKLALLHELGHASKHYNNGRLYNISFSLYSKMENEANLYMINTIIEENEGQYNFTQLIDEFDIGMGYDVRFAQ